MAVTLQRAGYDVTVYERYPDIRTIPNKGRSINLVATSRGLRAVRALGPELEAALLKLAVPVSGRIVHHADGDVAFQPYGSEEAGDVINSVSRYGLNKFLIAEAERAGAHLCFGHALESVDVGKGEDEPVVLRFSKADKEKKGGEEEGEEDDIVTVRCAGPVIASDGAGSRIRQAMAAAGLTEFSAELLDHTYKELLFVKPEKAEDMPTKGLHIWPRGRHMIMGLANLDGSFTGTVYMPSKSEEEKEKEKEKEKEGNAGADAASFAAAAASRETAAAFFNQHYADAVPLIGGMERAVDQMVNNPEGVLGTVRTEKWHHGGKICLVGDASHAIVPFFGQGMNSGFEDVRVMAAALAEHAPPQRASRDTFAAAFKAFDAERRPNCNAIADMALENYIEMRDRVGDKHFLLLKKVEHLLEAKFPTEFRSRYSMVCYGGAGNVTYANAQRLGAVQWELVAQLAQGVADDTQGEEALEAVIDMQEAKKLIAERVTPLVKELKMDLSTVSH